MREKKQPPLEAAATRPDGTEVGKYTAPKAVLMSDIIKGILIDSAD